MTRQSVAPAAALALSEALGCRLTVLASRPWASITFSGERALLSADSDLPGQEALEAVEVTLTGAVLGDVAAIDTRRLEVLLIDN